MVSELESNDTRRERFSTRRIMLIGGVVLALVVASAILLSRMSAPYSSGGPTVAFDFDTGDPVLAETQNTPLSQASNGVTAHFSSPSDTIFPAFSIQSYATTFIKLSKFSGKYLYDNKPSSDVLEIQFSQQITSITLTFATVEYKTEPSNITLTAYASSSNTAPLGSTSGRGTFQNVLYPQGILSYDSGGQPFDLVKIEIPFQGPEAATNFFVDNIRVKTLPQTQ